MRPSVLGLATGFALVLASCAFWQNGGAKTVLDVAQATECVVEHDESVEAALEACAQYGVRTAQDVASLLAGPKKYAHKHVGLCK